MLRRGRIRRNNSLFYVAHEPCASSTERGTRGWDEINFLLLLSPQLRRLGLVLKRRSAAA